MLLTTYKHIASIFTKNLNLNAIINCKVQNKTYIFRNKLDLDLHNCTKWIKNNNAWNKLLRLNLNLFICRLFHSYFFYQRNIKLKQILIVLLFSEFNNCFSFKCYFLYGTVQYSTVRYLKEKNYILLLDLFYSVPQRATLFFLNLSNVIAPQSC